MTAPSTAVRDAMTPDSAPPAGVRLPLPEARQRIEPETHHIHEVRLTRAPEPKGSSGMPTVVAGGLALVVGLAGGFGYSTYKALQTPESEPAVSQFEPVTSSSTAEADDLAEEFRDESVAALFQVPASPTPTPTAPPATAVGQSADPTPTVSNPFEVVPSAPATSPASPVSSGIAPTASTWASREKKALTPRSPTPARGKPATPQMNTAVDPAIFVAAPNQFETQAAPVAQVEPLLLPAAEPQPQSEPQPTRSPAPFQRPITDGGLRGPVMPVQFEEGAPAAPKSFAPAPAQDGFGFADEAPAAPSAPATMPPGSVPPVAQSTVPSFDLGGADPAPTPVAPPAFPSNAFEPAQRPAPAPFAPAQDPAGSIDLNSRSAAPSPFAPSPAPTPAPFAAEPGTQSVPVPAARANPGPADLSAEPPNWSTREEAAAVDPFRPAAPPAAGNGQYTGEEAVHTVESGENYWTISRKHYGMGRYFVALAEFNKARIPDPKMLKPGMKVVVPTSAALTEKYAHLISGAAPVKTYAPQTADASGEPAIQQTGFHVDRSGQPLYRVAEGDTLSDIAETCLGRSSRWVQIYGLNRDQLKSPNDLKLGMLLRLPQDASGVQAAPEASVIR